MSNKKIRILVDAHCFDGEYQGSRTFVKEIYNILAKEEALQLYIAAFDVVKLRSAFPSSTNIIFLKYMNKSSMLRLAFDIPRLIRKHQIDYAHFQYITPLFKNCKQIITIHDVIFDDFPEEFSFWYRWIKKRLYKRSASSADILTTVSAYSKSSIQKHLKTKTKVHLISNGINEEFFDAYRKESMKASIKKKYGFEKFILFVSRIEPRKNHVTLLKAYLDLKLYIRGYQLVLIGHLTKKVPELQSLLANLDASVKPYLFIRDDISDKELIQFYRAADLFVYPSKAEGFGIPPLEAGAARVPVICSNTSAMEAYTFFGDFHIDPMQYDNFKQKLDKLTEEEYGQVNLEMIAEQIKQTYSWQKSAQKLYQLITANN